MDLQDYLYYSRRHRKDVAANLGMHPTRLSAIATGRTKAGAMTAMLICAECEGKVTPEDLRPDLFENGNQLKKITPKKAENSATRRFFPPELDKEAKKTRKPKSKPKSQKKAKTSKSAYIPAAKERVNKTKLSSEEMKKAAMQCEKRERELLALEKQIAALSGGKKIESDNDETEQQQDFLVFYKDENPEEKQVVEKQIEEEKVIEKETKTTIQEDAWKNSSFQSFGSFSSFRGF